VVAGQRLRQPDIVREFYHARGFSPAWVGADGAWQPAADTALALLRQASSHGLTPSDYHLAALDTLSARLRTGRTEPIDRLGAEVLLTDALLFYGSHLLHGRSDRSSLDPEWIADGRRASVATELSAALDRDRLRDFETALAPHHAEYAALREALARLRASERWGGWGTLGDGPTLRVDSTEFGVDALRRRLRLSTDPLERILAAQGTGAPMFDRALEEAVRHFQTRHGLDPDGVVGSRTREALNVGVTDRIAQVEINLERWRWLPDDLGRRHVRINIPAFTGEVWTGDTLALQTRAIVGQVTRMTPSFNSSIEYLVLAPYWHVPPTIAAVDKLPLIRNDPGYVAASRMTLFDAATNRPVDATTVDWSGITGAQFNRRFRLRQEPGPANALGDVKFVFPNRHSVYLHDTPQKGLFSRTTRALSSGCVRLERALEVADQLLSDQPEWTPDRIRRVVAERRERRVDLSHPVPVYLLYFTAFVEPDGTLHLRPDIYRRDGPILSALHGRRPDS
jgi:murein L,D-transpeptidase YcbB/YkuD